MEEALKNLEASQEVHTIEIRRLQDNSHQQSMSSTDKIAKSFKVYFIRLCSKFETSQLFYCQFRPVMLVS